MCASFTDKYVKISSVLEKLLMVKLICKNSETKFMLYALHKQKTSRSLVEMCSYTFLRYLF